MIKIRRSNERGFADHGWLLARHSFSFADYYDPANMGFRVLRVINEDQVLPDQGFGTHPHRDMEIITYILEGSLEHKDSMGNGSIIRPGDLQYMSAGKGVLHSEFNPSSKERVHLLQIWILPNVKGAEPRYDQRHFDETRRRNQLCKVVSPNGDQDSIAIRQEASIYASILDPGHTLKHSFGPHRFGWIQVARGTLQVQGQILQAGDGAALENETSLTIQGQDSQAEFLLFDLP